MSTWQTSAATRHVESYRFQLEFTDEQGRYVAAERLSHADFERAVNETWFHGFRSGLLPAYEPDLAVARIAPRFRDGDQHARADGFRVSLPLPDGRELSRDFDADYVGPRATRARVRVLRERELPDDTTLLYGLAAFLEDHDDERSAPATRGILEYVPVSHAPSIVEVAGGTCDLGEAWDAPIADELPVTAELTTLEEICDEAGRHTEREVGGLLLGRLVRGAEMHLEVTCIVDGEGTTASTATSVTLTPDLFAKARDVARLRAAPGEPLEMIVGWYHSHPWRLCAECPLSPPPECLAKVLFYSADDIDVMESVFAQPYHIGLLAAVEPRIATALGHLPVRMYGWRSGQVVQRGFRVFRQPTADSR